MVGIYSGMVIDVGQIGSLGGTGWPAVNSPGTTGATQISTGGTATCAVLADKTLRCYGSASHGTLGNGETNYTTAAGEYYTQYTVVTPPFGGVESISLGTNLGCAIFTDQKLKCWGIGNMLGGELTQFNSDAATPTALHVVKP